LSPAIIRAKSYKGKRVVTTCRPVDGFLTLFSHPDNENVHKKIARNMSSILLMCKLPTPIRF
jgi:hypothetical protein